MVAKKSNADKVLTQLKGFTVADAEMIAKHCHLTVKEVEAALAELVAAKKVSKKGSKYSV